MYHVSDCGQQRSSIGCCCLSRKSHCIWPSSGQTVANSALGSQSLATPVIKAEAETKVWDQNSWPVSHVSCVHAQGVGGGEHNEWQSAHAGFHAGCTHNHTYFDKMTTSILSKPMLCMTSWLLSCPEFHKHFSAKLPWSDRNKFSCHLCVMQAQIGMFCKW